VLIDQITKLWAVATVAGAESVEILGQFFKLTLVYNQGGAMGTSFGSSTYYLVTSSIILLFVLYYIYTHRDHRGLSLTLAFIAGGAVGNIIDRIRVGHVIDFLDFDFFDINLFGYRLERWWAFNIADAAITCAIVWLLFQVMFRHPKEHPDESTPAVESPAPSRDVE